MIWPILWIVFMVGLITSVIVVWAKENAARKRAAKARTPIPMSAEPSAMGDQDLSTPDPLDGFGDVAPLDNTFDDAIAFVSMTHEEQK